MWIVRRKSDEGILTSNSIFVTLYLWSRVQALYLAICMIIKDHLVNVPLFYLLMTANDLI